MQLVHLTAHTIEELEELQAHLQEQADATGKSFEVTQMFRVGKNAPCICGSGKKWKKCCMEFGDTKVVIRPKGEPPGGRKQSKVGALAFLGMTMGLIQGDL